MEFINISRAPILHETKHSISFFWYLDRIEISLRHISMIYALDDTR